MSDLIGHSLGRYQILEQLGEGGMAVVYKARDMRLEADVAVKVIRTENILPSALERTLKRFEREAKALARLTHPNIVKVTDYGEYENMPYLVMPLLSGGTLKSKLNGKHIPWQDAVQILIPIANALGYAHKHDIIHRDVKPANILIAENGQPMLADFGVAKLLEAEETMELTGTGVGIGTPEYMAPEQATNKLVDARVDIYALGVVLFEMVTGRKPYIADTPMAVLIMHSRDPLPRPKSFAPNLPQSVENVLIKALAKDPRNRYQSMAEFAQAMEGLSSGKKISEDKKRAEFKLPAIPRRMAITVGLLALGVGLFAVFSKQLSALPAQLFATAMPTFTTTPSHTPMPVFTSTPGNTLTPIATNTPLITATPALGIGSTFISDGLTMLYVPAGEFSMGSNDGNSDEQPVHTVYLDGYYVDKYEVTNAAYKRCVDAGMCLPPQWTKSFTRAAYYGVPEFDEYPVMYVNWNMAKTYCEWRDSRLPTEAEWEKAARGTDGRINPWGNEAPNNNLLNYTADTTQVGSYESGKSPYGVYDMTGNVNEWVSDWYSESYYQSSPASNPLGPGSGKYRVLKSFCSSSQTDPEPSCYSANRFRHPPSDSYYFASGFRCARSSDKINSTVQTPAPATTTPTVKATTSLGIGSTFVSDGVTMLYVPAGEFSMGSNDGDRSGNEKPVHTVYLDGYYVDKYEVTNSAYKRCVDADACLPPEQSKSFTRAAYYGNPEFDEYPVIYVGWDMAKTYCEWRGARLPTEAEWEKAARGTDERDYPWGNSFDGTKMNFCDKNCPFNQANKRFDDGYTDTAPVGSYESGNSPYGIYDMAGNVYEWVYDWYGETYYRSSPLSNPLGPSSGKYRVERGNSWSGTGGDTVGRAAVSPDLTGDFTGGDQDGFRCAVSAADASAMISTPSITVSPTPTK